MKRLLQRGLCAALLLGLALGLAACGSGAAAMHLRQTEGTVSIADEAGQNIEPKQNLSLHSGYRLATELASYAWIDLDNTKLAKLDQSSQVTVQKQDKKLELEVESGSLFFNVSKPLASDESLTIRSSTMAVGIRGTSGWVQETHTGFSSELDIYVLEGTVEVSLITEGDQVSTTSVSGGEMAKLISNDDRTGSIEVYGFEPGLVPDFVLDEVRKDDALAKRISEGSDLELDGLLEQNDEDDDGNGVDIQALAQATYFGDYNSCRLTAAQAALLADTIEQTIADSAITRNYASSGQIVSYAALVDPGNGVPMLLLAVGVLDRAGDMDYTYLFDMESSLWQLGDNGLVKLQNDLSFIPYQDHMLCLSQGGDSVSYYVYEYAGGLMPAEPTTSSYMDSSGVQRIDGQAVSSEQLQQWLGKWYQGDDYPIHISRSPGFCRVKGCQPADVTVAALRAYAGHSEVGGVNAGETGENAGLIPLDRPRAITSRLGDVEILRTDLSRPNLIVYYEIPQFAESSEAYKKINAYFNDKLAEWLNGENGEAGMTESVVEMAEMPNYYNETYSDIWETAVTEQSDKYISVNTNYFWYMGGVTDYGSDNYVFSAATGDKLILSDVIAGSDEEIRNLIADGFLALDPYFGQEEPDFLGETILGRMRQIAMTDYDFYIANGQVHVAFDKYEIAAGAAGAFDVVLDAPLK